MAKWEDELLNLDCEKLTVADTECLLHWYGAWRGEKMSKSKKVSRLVGVLATKGDPPTIEEWTAEDEECLQSLQNNKITQGMTTWMVIPLGEFDCLCFIRSVGRYYPTSEVSSWLVGGKLVRGKDHLDHLYDCILNNRIDDNI